MHNIQTTTDTTEAQPTLADFISAYRNDRDAKEQQQNEDMLARVEENIGYLRDELEKALSRQLYDALQFAIRRSVKHPHFGLVEAYFSVDGVMWSIWHNDDMVIEGPRGYQRIVWPLSDDNILSAITEYPAWMARQQEEERRKSEPHPYTEITAVIPGDGFLHRGAQVWVNYARHYSEDGGADGGTDRGKIAAWDNRWLLLTLASGHQKLINRQHIESIQPISSDQPTPEPKPARSASGSASGSASDDVPF